MVAQGSKRPRWKLPFLLKPGLDSCIASLLLSSTGQIQQRLAQFQVEGKYTPYLYVRTMKEQPTSFIKNKTHTICLLKIQEHDGAGRESDKRSASGFLPVGLKKSYLERILEIPYFSFPVLQMRELGDKT